MGLDYRSVAAPPKYSSSSSSSSFRIHAGFIAGSPKGVMLPEREEHTKPRLSSQEAAMRPPRSSRVLVHSHLIEIDGEFGEESIVAY
jgi:hypothetical protein